MRIEAEGYAIHVRAVAGVESCCYIENLDVAFDIGCCPRFAANKGHVFITHGHADHISAFATHAARRSLQRMKPAKYYVPAHLVPHMQQILASFSAMQGDDIQAEIVPLAPLDEVHISAQWMVKAVPTMHRVASLGYILYRKEAKLKREYVGMKGREIGALRRDGHEVTTAVLSPEIAYTGDTTIDVFDTDTFTVANAATSDLAAVEPLAHVNDLLNVKVLITEVRLCVQDREVGRLLLPTLTCAVCAAVTTAYPSVARRRTCATARHLTTQLHAATSTWTRCESVCF